MTEQAPPKEVKLSRQQQLENILFSLCTFGWMIGTAYWYVSLCIAQYRAHKREHRPGLYFPSKPVTINLFGVDPEQGRDILGSYGIRSAYCAIQWVVLDQQIGLLFTIMVSKQAFDYADNILFQHSGVSFDVMTNGGDKRGQALRRPYAQRQPHQQAQRHAQPARRTVKARLGGRYS